MGAIGGNMSKAASKLTTAQISGIAAMLLGTMVIANDFTALNVALPAIEKAFGADVTTVQWVISGYILVFGVFIVTAGRLADMFGRRRIFFIGMTIFAVFSLIGGLAEDVWMLLAARAIMGIGGSMVWPALIAMIYGLLPEDKAALGGALLMGCAGAANAMGPMLGGMFTEYLSWRWIFYINVPVAALALVVIYLVVEKDKENDAEEKVDYPGILTLSLGLFALLLLLDIGAGLGWFSPVIIGLFCGSAVFLALFLYIERRSAVDALVPSDIMDNREYGAANLVVLLVSAVYFGALLYLPQFMVKELGYTAAEAGVGLAPILGMFALTSFFAAPFYDRLGPKMIISMGTFCIGLGIFILSLLDASTPFLHLVPGMLVLGMGFGLFYSSITTAAITSVDEARTGLASAIIFMVQNAGGAVGLGLTTALVVTASALPDGIERAFLFNAILALIGLIISLLFVGGPLTRETLFPPKKTDEGEN